MRCLAPLTLLAVATSLLSAGCDNKDEQTDPIPAASGLPAAQSISPAEQHAKYAKAVQPLIDQLDRVKKLMNSTTESDTTRFIAEARVLHDMSQRIGDQITETDQRRESCKAMAKAVALTNGCQTLLSEALAAKSNTAPRPPRPPAVGADEEEKRAYREDLARSNQEAMNAVQANTDAIIRITNLQVELPVILRGIETEIASAKQLLSEGR